MALEVVFRTVIPLTILIAVGFCVKRYGIFKHDEERVLSLFAYYLALPAFLFINIAETVFSYEIVNFVIVSISPLVLFTLGVLFLFLLLKRKVETMYTLIVCSSLGSVAFFGIPFILFAFPTAEAEQLAAVSTAVLGIGGLAITVFVLELHAAKKTGFREIVLTILPKCFKNPLIFSIVAGLICSLFSFSIWEPISDSLKMLGRSAAPVALVMLGAYLYGKSYHNLRKGFLLSQTRIIILPLLALIISRAFHLPPLEEKIVVLMNAMPLAIAVAVFSQKYHFQEDTITSTLFITSLSAVIHLNLWLVVLAW